MGSLPSSRLVAGLTLCTALSFAGCHSTPSNTPEARAKARADAAGERQQLEAIPAPVKSRFMTVRSYDAWENPYITVQPDMLTVHIMFADVNPSPYGAGGLLRPTGARRQQVNISLGKLAEAMSAIPRESWPYGRVVAVEEAHQTPGSQEPTVRRNLEAAVATLNDLGIAAYDLNESNLR